MNGVTRLRRSAERVVPLGGWGSGVRHQRVANLIKAATTPPTSLRSRVFERRRIGGGVVAGNSPSTRGALIEG